MTFIFGIILSGSNMAETKWPEVPDSIKAPAGEKIVLQVHATGVQVYGCQAGPDGKLVWTLKRPEADLFDQQGNKIGQHGAGPSWKHNDGSEVIGKVSARADSPSGSIPWLLLNAANHSGNGVLSHVTTIQRIHTEGGQPPKAEDCNTPQTNSEAKIKYSADYYFYAANK
jgi:hypothetical protein